MEIELHKRWRSTETVLERARLALPEPQDDVREAFGQAIAEYQDFLSQNELGLAFDSLITAAELVPSRGGVWKDLIHAAEFLELQDRVPDLEKRFITAAGPDDDKASAK